MGNALVVRGSKLPSSQEKARAAQYVRMSTDYQRYSIQNQATVIAAYAQVHGLTIVRTYRDEGESGLKLKNRAGLTQLLNDVQSGRADFHHILVYDVSRWGRFQDTDESAHYEYVCKKAGIKVAYCAEQFDNDGTMMSSILKNLKRVMAAEYSRELSAKVHAGACRLARLGFRIGGEVGYGLRRRLVDEKLQTKTILKEGDRKYLITDHVRVSPGTTEEKAVIRWIFERFLKEKSETAIARELNRRGIRTRSGRPWRRSLVGWLIRNESYIGNLVYNRRSRILGQNDAQNPPALWIRSEDCIEPTVERSVFMRVQQIIKERRVQVPEEVMLARLRRVLLKKGKLSPAIINETLGLPCVATYVAHFGNLREAYRLIGYTSRRDCEYIESRRGWADLKRKLGSEMAAMMMAAGGSITRCGQSWLVNQTTSVSFLVARCCHGKLERYAPHWSIQSRTRLPRGWVVAMRLGERNKVLLDYLLLPAEDVTPRIRFSEKARIERGIERFEAFPALVQSLTQRLGIKHKASSNHRRSTSTRN
jgi:DNA invertase Pin-like site-specific DNA recombinase